MNPWRKDISGQTKNLVIDLGHHKMRFIPAPMVHWPEVTFTYEETEKILFSADAFGTFGVLHGSVFSDDTDYEEEYLEEARRYYMSIIAKYGAQVLRTLQKQKTLMYPWFVLFMALCIGQKPIFPV